MAVHLHHEVAVAKLGQRRLEPIGAAELGCDGFVGPRIHAEFVERGGAVGIQIVGHVIDGNRIAIDTIAVLPDVVKQDQPRLCPAPTPDVAGSDQGKQYEENRSRQYEDFVKLLINPPPEGPTPSGFVYYLPLPEGGEQSYDDCKKLNGFLFEIKGEGLAKLTNDLPGAIGDKFVDQASRQLAASGGRPVIWIFAERDAALFTRTLFDLTPGLERITVGYVPWTRSNR
jgi:hypothetical protein